MRPTKNGVWAGLAGIIAAMGLAHGLEFRTFFYGNGTSDIRFVYIPAREPLAALHARLHFRAAAGLSTVTLTAPENGAWSQVQPRLAHTGDAVDVWLMAPAMGESRDSSEKEMASLALTPGSQAAVASADQLIDSVEFVEALGPDGRKLSPAKNMTTSIRARTAPGLSQAREASRGNMKALLFTLAKAQRVRAFIANAQGRDVATLFDGKLNAGLQEITWDPARPGGKSLPPGTYFLRLQAGSFTYDRKMEVKP